MSDRTHTLAKLVMAVAITWHLVAVLAPAWVTVGAKPSRGRDFASYYYAVQVAYKGGDPYTRGELGGAAREEGSRMGVHPFLYPPPFLLLMAWALPLDLHTAYRVWFWMDEMWAAVAMIALWQWWRPLGPQVGAVLAVAVAAFTAVPANHVMGQANFPGLALAIIGLWAASRGRWGWGGAFMGAACMVKMSPALFVGWWFLRRQWKPALVACVSAVALSIAALPILGVEGQMLFYTRVLPTFGSGDYNGLTVPIGMFGNHSIPNLWHQLIPSGQRTLSWTAQSLSTVTMLSMLGALVYRFRALNPDPLAVANQVGAIGVALLLIPVYTYEHHCVWAIPAVVASVMAVLKGRLSVRWAPVVGLAVVIWAFEILDMRRMFNTVEHLGPLGLLIQEAKFGALVTLMVATAVAGGRYDDSASEPSL